MERFCATCGTRLEPPAESCPCCGRQIDWDAASQPLSFVKQESAPAAQADADAGAEGSLEELEEKDTVCGQPGEAEPGPEGSEGDGGGGRDSGLRRFPGGAVRCGGGQLASEGLHRGP